MTMKRFATSVLTSDSNNQVLPAGTLVWDAGTDLRLHDGTTSGGRPTAPRLVGAWDPQGNYLMNIDIVTYNGGCYLKIGGDGNSGSSPDVDAIRWQAFGSGGSTGDVTFSTNVVQGTGYELGLSPGADFTSGAYTNPLDPSLGPQYLRVRGGDNYEHIHLDTTNNSVFDFYLGDDGKYVRLARTGDIVIGVAGAWEGNPAAGYRWTFDNSGNLTVPGDIYGTENNDINVKVFNATYVPGAGAGFLVEIHQNDTDTKMSQFSVGPENIVITTDFNGDFSGASHDWTFGKDGKLTAPGIIGAPQTVLTNGDDENATGGSSTAGKYQIAFDYSGQGWQHWIHTTHSQYYPEKNRIEFYTNDGTQAGVFPDNGVLGLTIENGGIKVGASGVTFNDDSKFKSASWTLVETISFGWNTTSGNMSNTINHYKNLYNDLFIKTTISSNAGEDSGSSHPRAAITIPLSTLSAGEYIAYNGGSQATVINGSIQWPNFDLTTINIAGINYWPGLANNATATIYIYAR